MRKLKYEMTSQFVATIEMRYMTSMEFLKMIQYIYN